MSSLGGYPLNQTQNTTAKKHFVGSVCIDLLLLETSLYLMGKNEEEIEFETFCERKMGAALKYENIGFEVGYRLTERLTQSKMLGSELLDSVKFICKDFWNEIFAKQVDKLQTDHSGTFVLRDLNFKWLGMFSPGELT
mmetsp:Transcript_16129/g.23922  ORF Transcript_16129/g.23922 Transcript_16129/m.23922 type:complete len:138 (+) Transcript_16129:97-510(+)